MITEMVRIEVKPGEEAQFEEGARKAQPLFLNFKNCHGMGLKRSIEHPSVYFLLVQWESVDDHMVHFRNSEAFQQWRALVGSHFAGPLEMQHLSEVFA